MVEHKMADMEIVISNMVGQEMHRTILRKNSNEIDLSELPSGVYLLKANSDNYMETIHINIIK